MTRSKGVEAVFGGTQLAVSVLLCIYIGARLDRRWGTSPWGLLAGGVVGVGVGLYGFLAPFLRRDR